jgi:hypothetical protein
MSVDPEEKREPNYEAVSLRLADSEQHLQVGCYVGSGTL